MVQLTIQWDKEYRHYHAPPSLDTLEKVGTLIGKTFESLEEIAKEIGGWGWERMKPKEWPGHHRYEWHHPTNCESILLPDNIMEDIKNFPYLKRWPIRYHDLNYGAYYDLVQIEALH